MPFFNMPLNRLILYLILLGISFSCNQEDKSERETVRQQKKAAVKEDMFRVNSPGNDSSLKAGEEINIKLEAESDTVSVDSLQVFLGNSREQTYLPAENYVVDTKGIAPGNYNLRIRIFTKGFTPETHTIKVKVLSAIDPVKYGYRLIKEYPHDKGAYTQGLEYKHGYIFEGTGNLGESSLRKVDLQTGEIIKYRNLPSDIFGEGITILNNKIYQISYRSQVGFVYDLQSFELLNKIYYQNREGWGLTNDGDHILMSDGSHIIYFMDTTYFSVVKKVEVFDTEGEVNLLNELELIDGVLYANRYTKEEILKIDTASGSVIGRINMSGLLKPEDRHPSIDYFNGIAYDSEKGRIFVTGKYWPKIYQVEFVEQK